MRKMSWKDISILAGVVAGAGWMATGQLILPSPGLAAPAVKEAKSLEQAIMLEVWASPVQMGASAKHVRWPALGLLCTTESFSAEVVAQSDDSEKVEAVLAISGRIEMIDSHQVFLSFRVALKTKGERERDEGRYAVEGNAIVASGKPVVIFSSQKTSLILTATFVHNQRSGKESRP